jgi:hypothetical protein
MLLRPMKKQFINSQLFLIKKRLINEKHLLNNFLFTEHKFVVRVKIDSHYVYATPNFDISLIFNQKTLF